MNNEIMETDRKIRKIHPTVPQTDIIEEAAAVILGGGVVSFPTRCLYGLGADAFNEAAIQSIFDIKQRPKDKPILLLVGSPADVSGLAVKVPAAAQIIMSRCWPGQVTMICKANDRVLSILTGGTGNIGIRMPEHPVAAELVKRVGRPITGTSANISGHIGADKSPDADSLIADKVDLLLDAGPLKGGGGSTVVDVTKDPPVILREGIIPAAEIFKALEAGG
jgi:L-threonylcarbamoyladenylate synthase